MAGSLSLNRSSSCSSGSSSAKRSTALGGFLLVAFDDPDHTNLINYPNHMMEKGHEHDVERVQRCPDFVIQIKILYDWSSQHIWYSTLFLSTYSFFEIVDITTHICSPVFKYTYCLVCRGHFFKGKTALLGE